MAVAPFLLYQRTVASSLVASSGTLAAMIDSCARHHIAPIIKMYPFPQVKDGLKHLGSGNARDRIMLKNDL